MSEGAAVVVVTPAQRKALLKLHSYADFKAWIAYPVVRQGLYIRGLAIPASNQRSQLTKAGVDYVEEFLV